MSVRCVFIICCLALKIVSSLETEFWLDTFDLQPKAPVKVMVLRAVRGKDARLPCGQGKVFLDGPDAYVMWLKEDREVLYRWPNESTDINRFLERDRVFGTTCESGICYDDTYLRLKQVSERDEGSYRCRVHYQASPSVEYQMEVRLVESPGVPTIFNEKGEKITKGYLGPISLGTSFSLICEVPDGHPDILVYWRRNGELVEYAEGARPGVLRTEVRVSNATRAELDAHYECLALNSDVTEPVAARVIIKMYLPPIKVEIRMNNNRDFEAGQPRVVDCVVVGCVPPPAITWHLGDTMLRPNVHKELHDGNYTVSSLTLSPALKDSKRQLICRAHNSHLPDIIFEDRVQINVGYRPYCIMAREETVGAVPGDAESITCVVEASPEPTQFSWTFADTRTVYTAVKKVPNHDNRYASAITWLPSQVDLGPLLCRASNSFGEQKRPCIIKVALGGPPQPPKCLGFRSYPRNLRVQCRKSWDGGRPQTVHLELFNWKGKLVTNVTDMAGHFHLPDVDDQRNFTAIVYASSMRGRSSTYTMHLPAIGPLVASAVTERIPGSWSPYIEAVAVVLGMLVITVSIAVCMRTRLARQGEAETNPDLVPRTDGSFHREPDFVRDERVLGTTNITVNQLGTCQNQQYTASPVAPCRVVVGCAHSTSQENNTLSYYV